MRQIVIFLLLVVSGIDLAAQGPPGPPPTGNGGPGGRRGGRFQPQSTPETKPKESTPPVPGAQPPAEGGGERPGRAGRGGFGGGGGGFGGGGGRRIDPEQAWNFIAQGQASINLNVRTDIRERMIARGETIPADGILTKEMFMAGFEARRNEMMTRGFTPPPPPPPDPNSPPPHYPTYPSAPPYPQTPALPIVEEEVVRPTAIRFGKLPKELPSWFAELDTDQDGQVGLYEWRRAGRPTPEFVARDTNGDGFISPDECLRYEKNPKKSKPVDGDEEEMLSPPPETKSSSEAKSPSADTKQLNKSPRPANK